MRARIVCSMRYLLNSVLTRSVCLHKYQPIDFARASSTLVVQCACQYSCVLLVLYSVLARIALDKAETSKEYFIRILLRAGPAGLAQVAS